LEITPEQAFGEHNPSSDTFGLTLDPLDTDTPKAPVSSAGDPVKKPRRIYDYSGIPAEHRAVLERLQSFSVKNFAKFHQLTRQEENTYSNFRNWHLQSYVNGPKHRALADEPKKQAMFRNRAMQLLVAENTYRILWLLGKIGSGKWKLEYLEPMKEAGARGLVEAILKTGATEEYHQPQYSWHTLVNKTIAWRMLTKAKRLYNTLHREVSLDGPGRHAETAVNYQTVRAHQSHLSTLEAEEPRQWLVNAIQSIQDPIAQKVMALTLFSPEPITQVNIGKKVQPGGKGLDEETVRRIQDLWLFKLRFAYVTDPAANVNTLPYGPNVLLCPNGEPVKQGMPWLRNHLKKEQDLPLQQQWLTPLLEQAMPLAGKHADSLNAILTLSEGGKVANTSRTSDASYWLRCKLSELALLAHYKP
jgi:hypothetical protein